MSHPLCLPTGGGLSMLITASWFNVKTSGSIRLSSLLFSGFSRWMTDDRVQLQLKNCIPDPPTTPSYTTYLHKKELIFNIHITNHVPSLDVHCHGSSRYFYYTILPLPSSNPPISSILPCPSNKPENILEIKTSSNDWLCNSLRWRREDRQNPQKDLAVCLTCELDVGEDG